MIIDLRRFLRSRQVFYSLVGLFVITALFVQVSEYLNKGPMAIAKVKTDEKVVAITFDISWGDTYAPKILDILKEHNVKATFFIMGPWARKYPDLANRIVTDGHELGSHGYRHENYGDMSAEWVKDDILKAHAAIKEVTGKEVNLIRPPNGHYSRRSLAVTEELGYKTIIWHTDSLDWKNPGVETIIKRVVTRAKPGDIILLHASDTPVQTADALPRILGGLKEKGFRFATVGELLRQYPPVRH